ncbi:hypothetical protein [Pseudoalteromonas obscura]|uniref:Uncharacterized protein n=1 Tax=Pseudoalteromonas obscura TaxID=3048491 RepID=A0ABT7EKY6_9GAMM|nr:hypothetical protein [Pseudoalteromonas sp. P94(2023)]MDK2595714.1 hypothetical protein [Pseudoalteromonas sp. P94(2023)]
MNAIEQLRREVVTDLHKLSTLKKVWPTWLESIQSVFQNQQPTNKTIRILGNSLYDIFSGTSDGSRSQKEVSGGGAAWEALVCWYLNLCLIGSRTVVIKAKKAHIPESILHSISVNYGNFKSNTESDLLAITFPLGTELNESSYSSKTKLLAALEEVVHSKFHETELTVIQCKTNWNDNAQIPMLWDLIYSSKGFSSEATVGSHGYSHEQLKKFSYAFVTVPTVKPEGIKNTSTCVKRVQNLSGGNFWGLPSKTGVAMNVVDILDKNFKSALNDYQKGWNFEISEKVKELNKCNYFKL